MTAIRLEFDRLETGELVALHSHEGRTVAAIVHVGWTDQLDTARRWSLAGDLADRSARPQGHAPSTRSAAGEAAAALGAELGVGITGWTMFE